MSRVFDGLFHPQEIVAASYNSFHWHIRVRIVQINAANAKMSFTSDLTVIQRGFRNFFLSVTGISEVSKYCVIERIECHLFEFSTFNSRV